MMHGTVYRQAMVLLWLLALLCGCSKEPGPEAVVREFHTQAKAGRFDLAIALVDLDAKCRRMFGDLYADGPENEQARMRASWGDALKDVTAVYYQHHFIRGPGEITVSSAGPDQAEVVQRDGKFALVYLLAKGTGGWLIADRMHELDGVRPAAQKGIDVMLQQIRNELGREPNLTEVNDRLAGYLKRIKIRKFRVGGKN